MNTKPKMKDLRPEVFRKSRSGSQAALAHAPGSLESQAGKTCLTRCFPNLLARVNLYVKPYLPYSLRTRLGQWKGHSA